MTQYDVTADNNLFPSRVRVTQDTSVGSFATDVLIAVLASRGAGRDYHITHRNRQFEEPRRPKLLKGPK